MQLRVLESAEWGLVKSEASSGTSVLTCTGELIRAFLF